MSAPRSIFVRRLLKWYDANGRKFPWRTTDDPYKIWLAEALLQRTRAELVEREYGKIIKKYPNISSLAKAPLSEIRRTVWTLGLAHRVRYLKNGAEYVVGGLNGKFPANAELLKDIPGVGDYIKNAILLFAYNQRTPPVDVNVVRLLTRAFGLKPSKKRPHTDPAYRESLEEIMPEDRAQDFMYAIIDFASLVCTKKPNCEICPLTGICAWFREHR